MSQWLRVRNRSVPPEGPGDGSAHMKAHPLFDTRKARLVLTIVHCLKRRKNIMGTANTPSSLGSGAVVPVSFQVQRIFFAICMVLPFPLLILELVTAGNLNPANGSIAIANEARTSLPPPLLLTLVTTG